MMVLRILLPLFLAALLSGCASSRTFSVDVRNDSPEPVTIGLTKEGGPFEDTWASPEEILGGASKAGHTWSLEVVPPGRSASAENITGSFAPGSRGILRVYEGNLTVGEMARVKAGSPERIDLPLTPGHNSFVVRGENGHLTVAAPSAAP